MLKDNEKYYINVSEDVNVGFCYQIYSSVRDTYL